jgi:hypothetical protein
MRKKNGKMRKMAAKRLQMTQRQIEANGKIRSAAGHTDLDPCHSFRRRLATKTEEKFGVVTAMKAGGWMTPRWC